MNYNKNIHFLNDIFFSKNIFDIGLDVFEEEAVMVLLESRERKPVENLFYGLYLAVLTLLLVALYDHVIVQHVTVLVHGWVASG